MSNGGDISDLDSQAPVRPGDVVDGKYRVERVLGAGGMGVVVAATHLQLGSPVAIKFVRAEAARHPEVLARFHREAQVAAQLTSTHVARVTDLGVLPAQPSAAGKPEGARVPYMVLEYLEGTDLAAVLHERGPLPIGEAVAYVVQACEAVEEAHARGIVHRDLKPANLFLAKRPRGAPIVKVLDFGISSMAVGEDDVRLTRTGAVMGSPRYMAPEQMLDASRADRRSDVWALGVILYELLTAAAPFPGRTFGQIHERILTSDAKPPSTLRPDITAALDTIILRCLRKPASERYQSVADLEQSLLPFKALAPASAPSFPEIEAPSAAPANIVALQPVIAAPVSRPATTMGQTVIGHPIHDKTEPSIGRTTVSWDTKTTLLRPGASVHRGRLMVFGGVAITALVGLVLFTLSRSRNPVDTEGVAVGQSPSQASEVVASAAPGPPTPVVQPTALPSGSTTVSSSAAPKRPPPAVAAPVKASRRAAPVSPPAPVASGPAKKSTPPTISADR